METKPRRPVTIYLSYALKDDAFKQEFEDYLAILQQNGLISDWIERQVQRGTDWSQVIDPRLLNAAIVLLLISPALVASGYCAGAEVREAFKRSGTGKTRVIPIILHSVNLAGSPFEMIVCLPRTGRPVSSWFNRSEAWGSIDKEIRAVIESYTWH
jgi:hypothetical protein